MPVVHGADGHCRPRLQAMSMWLPGKFWYEAESGCRSLTPPVPPRAVILCRFVVSAGITSSRTSMAAVLHAGASTRTMQSSIQRYPQTSEHLLLSHAHEVSSHHIANT